MSELRIVFGRTFLVLFLMFLLFKLMGKKQVSQMNMYDYITGIIIGSVAADICLDIEREIITGICCLVIVCLVAVILSYMELKSLGMRKIIKGKPTVLIKNGQMIREEMEKNLITVDMLECEARVAGYFDMSEINTAILEANGKMSFLSKDKNKTVVKKDLGIVSKDKGMVYNLIIDGEIVKDNLEVARVDYEWIKHVLKVKGKKISEILLMTINEVEEVKIFEK